MHRIGTLFVALLATQVATADEFDVEFTTAAPLGLQLTDSLIIQGFPRPSSGPSLAEATGWLRIGDRLVAVNEQPVEKLPLRATVRVLQKASLPKVLTFEARNGEDRTADMEAFLAGEGNLEGATGFVEVVVDGIPFANLPFATAMFGGNATCSRARVVRAVPSDACSAFRNDVSNAIVVVSRGACPFVDKAANVQGADGYAMVVVNDEDPAIRMPDGNLDGSRMNIHLPCVMVGATAGESFVEADRMHRHMDVVGRLRMAGESCDAFSPRLAALEAAAAEEEAAATAAAAEAADVEEARLRASLEDMMDFRAWPKNARARRRLYFRLSRLHHPDKEGGSQERFEVLSAAFEAANEQYARQR